ncbi:hypothetical protein KL930_005391 [Ogataea haglerorum]|uniref:Uncharacterized protein n=2 Tax=Ogataea TaxID=461281 RepID=A0AAN6D0E2_9ASCO|nr:hypothetical protein KL915_005384 [Ogataea haglerorum]KAG7805681.1 hypothetical protein KL921_005404 [Ogataea angusta]KAG7864598.1 hypothetical protein KL918_005405 [Ogataea parapolymorpha]KAG7691437.1 hypothetical protein KL951_005377 [Ogataea haglerorum]KAG7702122.1 hypothetical protein KL914_005384 [Ogataea haglerorum]
MWNLSPLQSSKISFEYLLLPPRSALEAVLPRFTPKASSLTSTPAYSSWHHKNHDEPLRASTRVSSGFTLFRHSSPSFGSQQLCSYSNPSENIRIGRSCTLAGPDLRSLSLRVRVLHPNTRIDVRLLGPCFKTGGIGSLRQHPRQKPQTSVPVGNINRSYNTPRSHIQLSLSCHQN